MTTDSASPPARVIDGVPREPEPATGATAPPRRIVVHPLAMLGWPAYAIHVDGSPRPWRRRLVLRRERGR
jgi:hypothetical protein